MGENLRTRKYNDGTDIPVDASGGAAGNGSGQTWGALTSGAHTLYAHDSISSPSNLTSYGYLYNWYAVNDSRKLCPTGWHVPSDGDWNQLRDNLNPDAGNKLKSTKNYWTPNTGNNNSSGFSALPGGSRFNDGSFIDIGTYAYFWSATEFDTSNAWYSLLTALNSDLRRFSYLKSQGASVRCLKD